MLNMWFFPFFVSQLMWWLLSVLKNKMFNLPSVCPDLCYKQCQNNGLNLQCSILSSSGSKHGMTVLSWDDWPSHFSSSGQPKGKKGYLYIAAQLTREIDSLGVDKGENDFHC